MAAMADYSTHNDDVALLMIRRKPDKAASGSLDSSGPADAGTAHERDIRWSGQHAIVTMPAEMDLANSSDVSDLLAAAARPSAASGASACVTSPGELTSAPVTASRACSAPAWVGVWRHAGAERDSRRTRPSAVALRKSSMSLVTSSGSSEMGTWLRP